MDPTFVLSLDLPTLRRDRWTVGVQQLPDTEHDIGTRNDWGGEYFSLMVATTSSNAAPSSRVALFSGAPNTSASFDWE